MTTPVPAQSPLDAGAPPAHRKRPYLAIGLLGTAVVITAVLLVLRAFLAASYRVPSPGMVPTIAIDEHVLVNKLDKAVARGKLVVYKNPLHTDQDLVKRVVGMPGDTISFKGTTLYVNGNAVPTCRVGDWSFTDPRVEEGVVAKHDGELVLENLDGTRYLVFHERDSVMSTHEGPWKVNDGEMFVVGDNRENSYDSRFYSRVGAGVSLGLVIGTVRPQGIIGLPPGAEGLKQKLTDCIGSI